ncbi:MULTISPECIES: P1 family peptidase [unclassified Ensifer]|uniref:P1 family peptidase n=1 Tax=unclassified Ensifer TaxID=2633371 RepID=UPI00081328BD|nr:MULTISPECIES: P1 family peptidase [unclassified Ensifer]OCP03898.1 peptidase T4 [Ensifer sp. LC11]OCP04338.1 peptidase T4 [Ensifer sp. LC13]OCP08495.1 peptidase T4 [Ensifer sp. LC14]OCP30421.1 peptidase T4 [Ensifer sp. LC499]
MIRTGPLNLITDVAGLTVGNAEDHRLKSGVTAIVCDPPATAAVQVLGGAPGTRETDLLAPHNTVQTVDGLVLSGGSAFGLDAASGAQAALREMGRGFAVGPHRIPIVPTAILFDLINGGDKDWGRFPPYRELGFEAVRRAGSNFATGTAGAGTGALTATVKGGLGSASTVLPSGITIGALVAVNALGSATVGSCQHFWAAPFEMDGEFGGLGLPHPLPADVADIRIKFRDRQSAAANTTIAVIATDAVLTKAEAKRLAIAAHDGFSRGLWPAHTPLDGDLIFALATGASGKTPTLEDFIDLGAVAASTMARAIARGVHDATPVENDLMPCWSQLS